MQRFLLGVVRCAVVFAAASTPALAQDPPLSQLVVNLFRPENYSNAVGVGPNHTAHFQISGGTAGTEILFLNAALVNQAIITQLTSLPLGSSSGGFTYSFNPELGTFDRSSESFDRPSPNAHLPMAEESSTLASRSNRPSSTRSKAKTSTASSTSSSSTTIAACLPVTAFERRRHSKATWSSRPCR